MKAHSELQEAVVERPHGIICACKTGQQHKLTSPAQLCASIWPMLTWCLSHWLGTKNTDSHGEEVRLPCAWH